MRWQLPTALLLVLALAGAGWGLARRQIRAGALAGSASDRPRPRQARPPHGGTAIPLGEDQFNVELVRSPATGTLQAFILDGELEDYLRIPARVLELQVEADGRRQTLRLLPVADAATGETVGDTSLFQARADWLRRTGRFQGMLVSVSVQGQTFRSVRFSFADGDPRP